MCGVGMYVVGGEWSLSQKLFQIFHQKCLGFHSDCCLYTVNRRGCQMTDAIPETLTFA